jgi:hypothetical protein
MKPVKISRKMECQMMESIRIISKEVSEGSKGFKGNNGKTGNNIGYNKGTGVLNSNTT